MKERIISWYIKYRLWFFFLSCAAFLAATLYLHGSVYRFVNIINGEKILPKDARSIGVFKIYTWLAGIPLFLSFFSGFPYIFGRKLLTKKERVAFLSVITFFIVLIVTSVVVIGVFYV